MLVPFNGKTPRIDESTWIGPGSFVIGDVVIEKRPEVADALRNERASKQKETGRVRLLFFADGARNTVAGRFWVSQLKRKYPAAAGVSKLSFALRIGAFLDHFSSFRAAPYLPNQSTQIGLPIL